MNSKLLNILVFALLTAFALSFHWGSLLEFPKNVHAWAQSDYLAIAWQYLQNGFNFFRPETYHFNHQFPNNYESAGLSTITSADFPVHGYIVAILMKLFTSDSPAIYRIYTLMYSLIGLFFLFRFSREIGNDVFKSILILLLALTSPIYIYYQAGFLPSTINTSNVFISLYFFARYNKSERTTYFIWTIFFLTLASLNRTSFSVPLIALFCYELYVSFETKSWLRSKWIGFMISFTCVLSYFFYNMYLRSTYGSIFLNEPLPAKSLGHAIEIIRETIKMWPQQYFLNYVSYLFVLIPLIPILSIWSKRIQITRDKKRLLIFLSIYFFGALLFSFLMLRQFVNHDYYFLDTLFVPLLVGLSLSISLIPLPTFRFSQISYSIILVAIAFPLITHSVEVKALRNEVDCPSKITLSNQNFINSDQLLEDLNIPLDAKLLVLDAETPNIPLMQMNRKGYVGMSKKQKVLDDMLSWPYDYVIIQNSQFISHSDVLLPDLKNHLKRIGGNGSISVCRFIKEPIEQTLDELLALDQYAIVQQRKNDFDGEIDNNWTGLHISKEVFRSGIASCEMTSTDDYGPGSNFYMKEQEFISRGIIITGWALKQNNTDVSIGLTVLDNEDWLYCNSTSISTFVQKENQWHEFKAYFNLPAFDRSNYTIKTFFLNTDHNNVFFDDIEIRLVDLEKDTGPYN